MKTRNIQAIAALLVAFMIWVGCEEKVDLKTDSIDPVLVVDGLIRDTDSMNVVKLTLTGDYFGESTNEPVIGALVTIIQDGTLLDTLAEREPGKYIYFRNGVVGSTYELTINYKGKTYQASSTLVGLNPIDSLRYEFKAEDLFTDEGYYVSIYTQESPETGNYFRFRYSSNGVIEDEVGWAVSDEFVNGNYIKYSFDDAYPQEAFDTVTIEVLSLSKEVYEFYVAAADQRSSGNLFDTPPGNAAGNVSGGAFGVFQASASIAETIVILP